MKKEKIENTCSCCEMVNNGELFEIKKDLIDVGVFGTWEVSAWISKHEDESVSMDFNIYDGNEFTDVMTFDISKCPFCGRELV